MRRIISLLLGLYVLTSFAGAEPIGFINTPEGVSWTSYDRLVLGDYRLKQNVTTIQVDELVLNGTLVTDGKELVINVRKLVFGPNGKIIAFDKPAEESQVEPEKGRDMPPFHPRDARDITDGADGAEYNLGPPKKAPNGKDGMQNPRAIQIFAIEVEGNPVVIGKGQKGGPGKRGGKGGRGQDGQNGKKGNAGFFGIGERDGGKGGKGGPGGPGGEGGDGGKGGKAVPITFYVGKLKRNQSGDDFFAKTLSEPGEGGAFGGGGSGGDPGFPGLAGSGDESLVGSAYEGRKETENLGSGPIGPKGKPGKAGDHLDMEKGTSEISSHVFTELELARAEIYAKWYEFHLERELLKYLERSLRISKRYLQKNNTSKLSMAVEKLMNAWNVNFIDPIQVELARLESEEKKAGKRYKKLKRSLSMAQAFTKTLNKLEINSVGFEDDFLLNSQLQVVKQSLEKAFRSCSNYLDKALSENLKLGWVDLTDRYSIPPCVENPGFRDASNLMKPIYFAEQLITTLSDSGLDRYLVRIGGADHKGAWILNFINTAYAASFETIPVEKREETIERLKLAHSDTSQLSEKFGKKLAYIVPNDSQITLDNIEQYLTLLAVQMVESK